MDHHRPTEGWHIPTKGGREGSHLAGGGSVTHLTVDTKAGAMNVSRRKPPGRRRLTSLLVKGTMEGRRIQTPIPNLKAERRHPNAT